MGCGRVGILLTQELVKAGHHVAVIDRHRSAEADERQAESDAQYEADRAAEATAQRALVMELGGAISGFMKLEERRVAALELIAKSCSEGVAVLRTNALSTQ